MCISCTIVRLETGHIRRVMYDERVVETEDFGDLRPVASIISARRKGVQTKKTKRRDVTITRVRSRARARECSGPVAINSRETDVFFGFFRFKSKSAPVRYAAGDGFYARPARARDTPRTRVLYARVSVRACTRANARPGDCERVRERITMQRVGKRLIIKMLFTVFRTSAVSTRDGDDGDNMNNVVTILLLQRCVRQMYYYFTKTHTHTTYYV